MILFSYSSIQLIFNYFIMMGDEINHQELINFLHTCAKSQFTNFDAMSRYLANLEQGLSSRFISLQSKRQSLLSQYKTGLTAEEINQKRRTKQEQQLKGEQAKLKQKIKVHQSNIRVEVHPMMPQLKIKSEQMQRLIQTKDLLKDFKKLSKGENPHNVITFTDTNFQMAARKVSILKSVLDDLPENSQYKEARSAIAKLLIEVRERILNRFQSAYWNKDFKQIKDTLPLCVNLNLMQDVSQFYISKVFRKANTLRNIDVNNQKLVFSEVKNLFFLLKQGFKQAFIEKQDDIGDINQYQIFRLFQNYSQNVLKSLINYVFQSLVKDSMQTVLKYPLPNQIYLIYLQLFVEETKTLRAEILLLIGNNQSLIYTVDSYISIIFQPYQEQYLDKELGYLKDIYERNSLEIMRKIQIKVEHHNNKRQFNWRNLFRDYRIQQSQVLTGDQINQRLTRIHSIFMDPNLESIFNSTNTSLKRNTNVSKSIDKQKNTVEILNSFMKEMGQLILHLIKHTGSLIPSFGRKTALSEQYFDIVPLLNTTVQRVQLIFQTFSVQKSNLNEGIKLVQEKQQLMNSCEQQLQKILHEALSSLTITLNSTLKQLCSQYKTIRNNQSATQGCGKTINFAHKYVKKIRSNFSSSSQIKILQIMGNQFLDLLMQHYSSISYCKQGLYQLLVDIGHYKQFNSNFNNQQLDSKYCSFKGLVDIYLLKNDEISLMNYVSQQKERSLISIRQQLINRYLQNKKRNQNS